MASKHDLLKNLEGIKNQEDALWRAFVAAEKQEHLSAWEAKRLFNAMRDLKKTPAGVRFQPLYLPISIICAVIGTIGALYSTACQVAFLLLYSVFLFLSVTKRTQFISAYSGHKLSTGSVVTKGFGIDNVSLVIFSTLQQQKNLTQPVLASIIKLVKATHEYEATTYGYSDHLRKTVIAAILAFPLTIVFALYNYWSRFPEWLRFIEDHNLATYGTLFMVLTLTVCLAFAIYGLAFGDRRMERRKKRYLLLLNVMHESWAK